MGWEPTIGRWRLNVGFVKSSAREGLVELRGEGRRKLRMGMVYVNPEGVGRRDREAVFPNSNGRILLVW